MTAPADPPWPAVSVIIATRDRMELLRTALRSILDQDYLGSIEVLVVFDQSELAMPRVGPVPPDRKLSVLANTRTPGLAGARNTGMLAAATGVVALCDDDDRWLPAKLSRQVGLMRQAGYDFVASGIRVRYADHVAERIPPPELRIGDLARKRHTALHPSTFVFRRALISDIGLVDEEIPGSYGEDYDLLLRAARISPVAAVPEALVEVLWHPESFFTERWQTITEALRYLLAKHPELRADPAGRARIDGQMAFAEAALARRREACRLSWRAVRSNPAERRAYLALAVAAGIVPASSVVRAANRRGHGI